MNSLLNSQDVRILWVQMILEPENDHHYLHCDDPVFYDHDPDKDHCHNHYAESHDDDVDDDDVDDDDVLSGMYGYQHLLLRDRYHDILQ